MNCLTCQQKMEEYVFGNLSEALKKGIRTHLEQCDECKLLYSSLLIIEKVIEEEKTVASNPFLATRVMAEIEQIGTSQTANSVWAVFKRTVQPAFAVATIALAFFIGVSAGTTYSNSLSEEKVPEEAVFMNDAALESIGLLME